MHNLGRFFKFETLRTLKKLTFWLTALFLLIGVLYGIISFGQSTTIEAAKNLESKNFRWKPLTTESW